MCFNDIENNTFVSKKFLIDTEINCLDDVYGFANKHSERYVPKRTNINGCI